MVPGGILTNNKLEKKTYSKYMTRKIDGHSVPSLKQSGSVLQKDWLTLLYFFNILIGTLGIQHKILRFVHNK